jgi:hypothetical protein
MLLIFYVLFKVAIAVFFLESLYTTGCIDIFLLARIERMAHRANLCVDFLSGAACLKGIAAAAMNDNFIVLWMYAFFHKYNAPNKLILRILTTSV